MHFSATGRLYPPLGPPAMHRVSSKMLPVLAPPSQKPLESHLPTYTFHLSYCVFTHPSDVFPLIHVLLPFMHPAVRAEARHAHICPPPERHQIDSKLLHTVVRPGSLLSCPALSPSPPVPAARTNISLVLPVHLARRHRPLVALVSTSCRSVDHVLTPMSVTCG